MIPKPRLNLMGIPVSYENVSLEEVPPTLNKILAAYIKEWETIKKEGVGLLFYGPPGAGKTSALVAMAWEVHIRNGGGVRVKGELGVRDIPWPIFFTQRRLKDELLKPTYYDEGLSWVEGAKKSDLVILDNFCTGGVEKFVDGRVHDFILERLDTKRPLCLTVDCSSEQAKTMDVQSLQKLLKGSHGASLYDKLDAASKIICVGGDGFKFPNRGSKVNWGL